MAAFNLPGETSRTEASTTGGRACAVGSRGGVDDGREGLHTAAPEQLALAAGGIERGVEVEAGEGLTRDPVLLDELAKGIVYLDVQGRSKFCGEIALGGMIHPRFSGGPQGALTR